MYVFIFVFVFVWAFTTTILLCHKMAVFEKLVEWYSGKLIDLYLYLI